jgi:nicotinate-nucleotide adenylyltransferase
MLEVDKTNFSLVGIYGGTFDPIHYGHLRIAEELVEVVDLCKLCFIPSGSPRLRQAPGASKYHRVAMLRTAIQDNSKFILDEREIHRPGESRSVVTLRELRHELTENFALCFLMGTDVFLKFAEWYCWRELFELCHIVIASRPGYIFTMNNTGLSQELTQELIHRQASHASELKRVSSGLVLTVSATMLDISATAIRTNIANKRSNRYLLPETVLEYIETNHLYCPKNLTR